MGSSVQVSELHGKGIEEQIDMFTLSAEMQESARNKKLKRFKNAEGQIAFTSVSAANRCTTVLAVNPEEAILQKPLGTGLATKSRTIGSR